MGRPSDKAGAAEMIDVNPLSPLQQEDGDKLVSEVASDTNLRNIIRNYLSAKNVIYYAKILNLKEILFGTLPLCADNFDFFLLPCFCWLV